MLATLFPSHYFPSKFCVPRIGTCMAGVLHLESRKEVLLIQTRYSRLYRVPSLRMHKNSWSSDS